MKNKFIIITICSRPWYLPIIYANITQQNYKDFIWIICYDSDEITNYFKTHDDRVIQLNYKKKVTDITNYAGLNYIIDYIQEKNIEGFIHIIDDDNIIYSNYFNIINNTINSKLTLKFIYYQQQYFNNTFRFGCRTKDIKEGHIDTAQVCFHTSLIEDTRFIQRYTADGIFYEDLFNKIIKDKSQWAIIPQFLCYYNYIVKSTKESTIIDQKRKIELGIIF